MSADSVSDIKIKNNAVNKNQNILIGKLIDNQKRLAYLEQKFKIDLKSLVQHDQHIIYIIKGEKL